MTLARRA